MVRISDDWKVFLGPFADDFTDRHKVTHRQSNKTHRNEQDSIWQINLWILNMIQKIWLGPAHRQNYSTNDECRKEVRTRGEDQWISKAELALTDQNYQRKRH